MPLTCAICLSSSQRYGECTTIEAPRVVWMPQHLQKYTKIQRRQIIFFYSLLFVIHSCVIDYFCCQTYLYSFHSFSSSSSRNAMYVEIHFTVAAADGADVDAKWKTLCVRWRMIQLSAHTHMTHTHTAAKMPTMKLIHPTNKWKWKCCLHKLILHQSIGFESDARLFFFSLRDFHFIYFPRLCCSFACSVRCSFGWANRLSLFDSCVRGFVFLPYILFTQFNTHVLRFTTSPSTVGYKEIGISRKHRVLFECGI